MSDMTPPPPGDPTPPMGGPPPPPGAPVPPGGVAKKEPIIALLLSFFWPGVGHMYIGGSQTTKGIILAVSYFVAILLSFILIGIPIAIGLWIYGMISANSAANAYNQAAGLA